MCDYSSCMKYDFTAIVLVFVRVIAKQWFNIVPRDLNFSINMPLSNDPQTL
jgi:hypothetical protein